MLLAAGMTGTYVAIQLVGAALSGSLAIVAMALDSVQDLAFYVVALLTVWVSARPPTARLSFGYYRAEVLVALASMLVVWGAVGAVIYDSTTQLMAGPSSEDVDGSTMFGFAVSGLVCKLIVVALLDRNPDTTARAACVDALVDATQFFGTAVAGALIWAQGWVIIDPIAAIVSSVFSLSGTITLLRQCLNVLLEGVPDTIQLPDVRAALRGIDGVVAVHKLHVWALDLEPRSVAAIVHLYVRDDARNVLEAAHHLLASRFNIRDVTVQVETAAERKRLAHDTACTVTVVGQD